MTFNEQVYALVRAIPAGRVLTYGAVARLLGVPRGARAVGWALRATPPDGDIPWHRVINAQGAIVVKDRLHEAHIQRERLLVEGVVFDAHEHVDLERFRWQPADFEARELLENLI